MKAAPDKLLLAVDLAGTFVFGLEGAVAGVRGNLDALGLMVVAFATALGGGLVRDLLIGSVPPNAIRDVRYGLCAFAGAAVVFFLHPFVQQVPEPLLVLIDAAGLSLFAIAGARKALDYNIPPFSAVLMGGITGVGGRRSSHGYLCRCRTSGRGPHGNWCPAETLAGRDGPSGWSCLLHPSYGELSSPLEPAPTRQQLAITSFYSLDQSYDRTNRESCGTRRPSSKVE